MFFYLSKFLFLVVPCLLSVAFLTLLERKLLGLIGCRLGPFKVTLGGLFQPVADAGKLLNKEVNYLSNFNLFFYYFSSSFMFLLSLFFFCCLSFAPFSFFFPFFFFLVFIVLGLNSLNSIITGWSTFSKFSLLGSIRTVSQLVSYEVVMYVCFFFILSIYFSFNALKSYSSENFSFLFFFIPMVFFIWVVSVLAELNRTPYDFSEGESELVSGFNIEFGSCSFTLIFLAEYGMIFFFMFLTNILYFDSSLFFSIFFFFLVVWIRSIIPRYRFDKLMYLSWKILLPMVSFYFLYFFLYILF